MRYIGPKGKINRRLGTIVLDSAGAVKAFEKRNYAPGMHAHRRRQISNYGFGLIEKQKICYYYGLTNKQFRRFFSMARRLRGNAGENLLSLCERRLDNVICRSGFTKTRGQARQGVSHGHFMVNGKKVDIASYLVNPGDVITVRAKENLQKFYKELSELYDREVPTFMTFDKAALKATIASFPTKNDFSLNVDTELVIEFVSR
jgi:small subunit ribosomal protein S4